MASDGVQPRDAEVVFKLQTGCRDGGEGTAEGVSRDVQLAPPAVLVAVRALFRRVHALVSLCVSCVALRLLCRSAFLVSQRVFVGFP